MRFVTGDLLDQPDFIAQQCNCLTVRGHGLAAAIARRFPAADCYARRRALGRRNLAVVEDRATPGTAALDGRVLHLFGQWRPGPTRTSYWLAYPECLARIETAEARLDWFRAALVDALRLLPPDGRSTIAVPTLIGCGLAGGDWTAYLAALTEYEAAHADRVEIVVVQLPPPAPAEKRKRV